jgi:fibronectin-binding autotransporter adhesin
MSNTGNRKSSKFSSKKRLMAMAVAAVAGVGSLFSPGEANASMIAWTGGGADANWSTLGNWAGGTAYPGATSGVSNTDTALFNAAIANTWGSSAANYIALPGSFNIQNINFDGAAGNYFIGTTGGNTAFVTAGGQIALLNTLTATNATETFNAPISIRGTTFSFLNNSASGTGAGAGTLIIGGGIGGAALSGSTTTTLTLGGSNTNANTVSGIIGNGDAGITLSVVKSGLGNWILSNANTYSGGTTVNAGTLTLTGTTNSASFYTASGGTLEFNVASGSTTINANRNVSITGAGTFQKTGAGTLTDGALSTTVNMSAGGLIDIQGGTFAIGNTANDSFGSNLASLNIASGATVDTTAGGNVQVDALTGAGSLIIGDWHNLPTSQATLTIGAAGGSGTFSGSISQSGSSYSNSSLVKAGAGTEILTGSCNLNNGTTISGGTLQIGNGGTTGSLGSGAIVDNGALVYNLVGSSTVASLPSGGITGTGTVNATAGNITFNGNVNTTGSQTYNATTLGSLYNGGEITASTVTLTATGSGSSITLTGDVGKRGGTGNNLVLNTSAGNGNINLNISMGRGNVWYPLTSFTANAGTGTITLSGSNGANAWGNANSSLTGVINIASNLSNSGALNLTTTGPSTISGVLSGGGSLVKLGASTLTISTASTYSGGTTVSNGTLVLAATSSLASGSLLTVNNGGYVSLTNANNSINSLGTITLNAGGMLSADAGAGQAHTINNLIQLNGGTLAGNANYSTTYGHFYMSGGNANIDAAGGTQSTISAVLGLANSLYGYNNITVESGATLLISGKLNGVSGSTWGGFNKLGAGTLILTNAANGNAQGMRLNGGTLQFVSGALHANVSGSTGYAADFQANSTLQWATGNTQDLSASSQIKIGDGITATLDTNGNNVTLGTAFVLGTNSTGALTKVGTGTLILTGANAYTGLTTVSNGTLQIGNGGTGGSLGTGAVVDNSALVYNLVGTSTTATLPAAGITGSGTLNVTADTIVLNGNVATSNSQTYTATTAGANNHGIRVVGSPSTTLSTTGGASITLSGDVGYTSAGQGGALTVDTSSGNGTVNLFISIGRSNSLYPVNSVTVNAGTGTINVTGTNAAAGWGGCPVSLTGAVNITGNVAYNTGLLTINSTANGSVSGNLSGSMSLTKQGAGSLTFSGTNSYSGGTTISAGKLLLASTGSLGSSSAVTVQSTGALGGTGTVNGSVNVSGAINVLDGSAGTLTLNGGLTTNANSSLYMEVGSAADLLKITGAFTVSGSTAINITALPGLTGGTYTLASFTSATNLGNLTLGSTIVGGYNLSLSSDSTHEYLTTVLAPTAYWKGGNTNSWSATGPTNFTTDIGGTTAALVPTATNDVIFTATGAGSLTLNTTLDANFDIHSLSFNNQATAAVTVGGTNSLKIEGGGITIDSGSGTHTISTSGGVIVGANQTWSNNSSNLFTVSSGITGTATGSNTTALTLNGTGIGGMLLSGVIGDGSGGGKLGLLVNSGGTVTFAGSNGYTGGTTITSGTLQVGNGSTGGTLGTGAVTDNSVLTFIHSDSLTVGNAISGSGMLNQNGAGTLTLTAADSYTGTTTVNSSTLALQNTNNSTVYSIATNATLEMNVASGTRDMVSATFSGTGTFRKTGAGQLQWGTTAATFSLGAGSLIDVQGGTFIGGSNANEVWTSNLASLNVAAGAAFHGVEANVRVDALTGSGTIQSGYSGAGYSNFTFGANGGTGNFFGTLGNDAAAGNFVKIGAGTQTLSGSNTYTGTTTVSGGVLKAGIASGTGYGAFGSNSAVTLANTAGVVLDITGFNTQIGSLAGGGTTGGNVTLGAATLTLGADGTTTTYAGIISGTGALTKMGNGTLTLTGANTYGATTISAGVLQVGNGGATGALGSGNILDNAMLAYNFNSSTGFTVPFGTGISGSGSLTVAAGTIAFNGNTTLGGSQTYTQVGNNGSLYEGLESVAASATLTGSAITMTGDLGHPYNPGDTVALDTSAVNGPINLNISLGRNNVWYNLSSFTANAGTGTITVSGTGPSSSGWSGTPVTLTGAVNITTNVSDNAAVTINSTANGSVSGAFSGSMPLTKQGNAALTLSASNTYTGGTTVTAGKLIVTNTTGSATGTGAVTVATGGTLAGSQVNGQGFITGPVTVNGGGSLSAFEGANQIASPVTLAINNALTLNNATGAILNFNLTATPNNTSNPLLTVSSLTLNGAGLTTVNITGSPIVGTYDLIGYGGTLANFAGFNRLASGPGPYAYLLSQGTGQVDLVVTDTLAWTGNAGSAGAGTWDTTAVNWGAGSAPAAPVSYVDGGNLNVQFNDSNAVSGGNVANSTVTIQGSGVTPKSVLFNNSTVNYTLSNASGTTGIAGSTGVTKSGTGTVTLAGANTYTGGTTINGGILQVNADHALGNSGTTRVIGGELLLSNNVAYGNTQLLSIAGSGISNAGALAANSTSSFAGAIAVTGDAAIGATPGNSLTLTGGISASSAALTFKGGGTINVSTTGISGTPSSINVTDAGTNLVLSAAYAYSDTPTTFISNNATLTLGASGVLSTTVPNVSVGLPGDTGSVLNLNGHNDSIATLMLTSGKIAGPGTLTTAGGVIPAGSGNVIGTGAVVIASSTDSTVVGSGNALTVDGTLSGTAWLEQPSDSLAGVGKVSAIMLDGGSASLSSNGTLTVSGVNSTAITVNSNGNVITGGTIAANALTKINDTEDLTINSGATLGGTGSVNVLSSSTLTVNNGGAIGGTGTVTVYGGSILVNNGTVAKTVNVLSGGTLSGAGVMNGAVTVSGTVHPGNSPGILTVNNTYTQDNNSFMAFDLGKPTSLGGVAGTDNGLINVLGTTGSNGNLTLGTGVTLNITQNANFGIGTYELFHYTGTVSDGTGNANLATWSTNDSSYRYTFSNNTALDEIVLTVASLDSSNFSITSPTVTSNSAALNLLLNVGTHAAP